VLDDVAGIICQALNRGNNSEDDEFVLLGRDVPERPVVEGPRRAVVPRGAGMGHDSRQGLTIVHLPAQS
jgi:hypothetical protein